MADLIYNGPYLISTFSNETKKYRASSGMATGNANFQRAYFQDIKDAGPIPEGSYKILLLADKNAYAKADYAQCSLIPSVKLQRIPRGINAIVPEHVQVYLRQRNNSVTTCEEYWANWGNNRIALTPLPSTKTFGRNGFYLHDSKKNFTHGCIEVEQDFFADLRLFMDKSAKKSLILEVKYATSDVITTWKGNNP